MKGEEVLPVSELTAAHTRLTAATELGRLSAGEQVVAQSSFEQATVALMEQVRSNPGMSKVERQAWIVAAQRMEANPNVIQEAERYLAKLKQVNKALKTPGVPILIWGKFPAEINPEALTYVSNGKGLTYKDPGNPDGRVEFGYDTEHRPFRPYSLDISQIVTEAVLSAEELEGIEDLIEPVNGDVDERKNLLIIGEEPIVAFVERAFEELDAEYESKKSSGHQGNEHIKYQLFKRVEAVGVNLYDKSEVVSELVDKRRDHFVEHVADMLTSKYSGRGFEGFLKDTETYDISPEAVLEAAREILDANYQKLDDFGKRLRDSKAHN
jgi:hypothetical protein